MMELQFHLKPVQAYCLHSYTEDSGDDDWNVWCCCHALTESLSHQPEKDHYLLLQMVNFDITS